MSKHGDLSLVGLLLGSPVFLPPPGVARVHRLKDEDGSVQERLDRLERYIEVIGAGVATEEAIVMALPFEATSRQVKEDLRDLVRSGAVKVRHCSGVPNYYLGSGKLKSGKR